MPLAKPYDPIELNRVQRAFPADALDYMPSEEDCAEWRNRQGWQLELQRDWMFRGIVDIQLIPKREGWGQAEIDHAARQIGAIQDSYAPKHEHKEAAVAFLIDQWFSHARWKVPGEDDWKGDWPDELDEASIEEAEEARAQEG